MRTSAMSHSFFRQFAAGEITLDGFFGYCAELGLDGVEISTHHIPKGKEEVFLTQAENRGFAVAAVDLVCDLVHSNRRDRTKAAVGVFPWVDRLAGTRTGLLMLSPGGMKQGFALDRIRSFIIDGMRQIVDYAASRSVKICIENHGGWATLRGKISHMTEFVEKVPGLKLVFDTGNYLLAAEEPTEALRKLCSHIAHVHIKDFAVINKRDNARPHLFCPEGRSFWPVAAGEGVVPFGDIISLLKTRGYDGFLSIEYEGEETSPLEALRSSLAYIRSLVEQQTQSVGDDAKSGISQSGRNA